MSSIARLMTREAVGGGRWGREHYKDAASYDSTRSESPRPVSNFVRELGHARRPERVPGRSYLPRAQVVVEREQMLAC